MSSEPESQLIARVVAHDDHQAFAELVRLHQAAIRRFLRRLTVDEARADDLAQETFWKAYRYIATYEARGRFLSWLFRIAYQEFVTTTRSRRAVEVPLDEKIEGGLDALKQLDERCTFDQLMVSLRAEERAAVVLHYRHGLTHPEIAEALLIPVGTVKSLIRRARLRLQQAHRGQIRGMK